MNPNIIKILILLTIIILVIMIIKNIKILRKFSKKHNGLSDIVIDEMCKKLIGYYVCMLEEMKESRAYDTLNEIKNQMPKKTDKINVEK